jgi:hypothetical protein
LRVSPVAAADVDAAVAAAPSFDKSAAVDAVPDEDCAYLELCDGLKVTVELEWCSDCAEAEGSV